MKAKNMFMAAILSLVVILVSCNTLTGVKETFDTNLIIKVAVAEVLYRNPSWKNDANKIARMLLTSDMQKTSFMILEAEARKEIEKIDTSPGTKVLANELVTAISAGIQADLKQQGITDNNQQMVKVFDFIRWLEYNTR